METGYDINHLFQQARNRWLKPSEVLFILQNHQDNLISHQPIQKPITGSLFLFNRGILPCFRKDGHNWRKKKNTNRVAESHEQLKVDNCQALKCYYAHGEDNSDFHRRCYWMLNQADKDIVLVHYRDTTEGNTNTASVSEISPRQSHTFSNSKNNLIIENQGTASLTDRHGSCQSLCSPGSLEVSSRMVSQRQYMDHLYHLDITGNVCTSSNINVSQVSQGIPEHLDVDSASLDAFISSMLNIDDTETLGSDSSVKELDQAATSQQHESYGGEYSLTDLATSQEIGFQFVHQEAEILKSTCSGITTCGSATNVPECYSMLSAPTQRQMPPLGSDSSVTITQEHKFIIKEISPQWGFVNETTKVIIIGSFLCKPSETSLACMFGDIEVPIKIIQDGVLSCEAPPKCSGNVSFCITSGNKTCSEFIDFEYRDRNSFCNDCTRPQPQQEENRSIEEVILLLKFVQVLLSESSLQKGEEYNFHIEALRTGSQTSSASIDWVLQELLKDKLQHWLFAQSLKSSVCTLPRKEQGIIHIAAGLGYEWALNPILGHGAGLNFRDTNGWTALHWAARFGREKMVAALIASGASVRTFADPTAQDPRIKTPAFIADANGYKGLAAYLSELELISHFSSLKFERVASVNAEPQVDASIIPMESVEDQSSMKNVLAASRNASEVAALIEASFRAHSFKKRQQRNASRVDEYGFTSDGLSSASKMVFPHSRYSNNVAALTIQKHFKGWKQRKGLQTLRQKVVKIQAQIRGYRVRKYYKVIWAVGIMEKIILRWRRKGAGLRGYKPEREVSPDDENEEEEDIVKVFRRQKVFATIREAVTRVQSMTRCLEARNQFTRMLETFRQAKAELGVLTVEEQLGSLADVFAMDYENHDAFLLPVGALPDSPGDFQLWA